MFGTLLLLGLWGIPIPGMQSPNGVAVETVVQAGKTAISTSSPLVGRTCTPNGNLFIEKTYETEAGYSVLELENDGHLKTTFHLPPHLRPHTTFVSKEGTLYWVATSDNLRDAYLLKYEDNGKLHSRTTLKLPSVPEFVPPIDVSQLAVFANGNFLIDGSQWTAHGEVPFTAVFRPDGSIERRLSLDGDASYRPESDIGSVSIVSDGGNAYLLRRTRPFKIYAISQEGEIVAELRLDVAGSRRFPYQMVSAGDRLVILFDGAAELETPLLGVFDLSGNPVLTLAVPQNFGSLLCYDPPQFITLEQVGQQGYELKQWRPR